LVKLFDEMLRDQRPEERATEAHRDALLSLLDRQVEAQQ
jgi:hypothetical protein